MVQGFKAKPPANAHKNKSSTQKKQQPKDLKKGGESPLLRARLLISGPPLLVPADPLPRPQLV